MRIFIKLIKRESQKYKETKQPQVSQRNRYFIVFLDVAVSSTECIVMNILLFSIIQTGFHVKSQK